MTEITKEQANAAVSSNEQVFDAAGLTDEYMAKKLKALTGAMETKAQIPKGSKEFVYSKNLKAHDIRYKALELTYKLKGKVPAEKHEHGGVIDTNVHIDVNFVDSDDKHQS